MASLLTLLPEFDTAAERALERIARANFVYWRFIRFFMREAVGEGPWRDSSDTGPLRILHPHPDNEALGVDPGRLKRSLIFQGRGNPPAEQIFTIESDGYGAELTFGSSVEYADWEYDPRFSYLAPSLELLQGTGELERILEEEFDKIDYD